MTTTIPLTLISLEGNGFHLLCALSFFRKKYWAVLDTGASRTVFDKSLLEKFCAAVPDPDQIQANTIFSTSETVQAVVPVFSIGKLKIRDYAAIGIDLSAVSETYATLGHPPIYAIIGGDLLNAYNARIDYASAELLMTTPKA